MERIIRHRVIVSTSVKGVKTWDATVEVTTTPSVERPDPYEIDTSTGGLKPIEELNWVIAERKLVLVLSDQLAQELDKRYPPVNEK